MRESVETVNIDVMNKTLYLVSNAHLDPVWQWEWEEGAAAAVSTFRVAARFCRERDGYVFCHNEAALYEWVEEYEPALFEEIRRLAAEGRWVIIGGWYIQPDCNMPAGETFVRHAAYGRKYFFEKFGIVPTVANSFDAFGHSRGLVQVLAKCGYKYYIHCRPGGGWLDMPDSYVWEGYDGSRVIGERQPSGYGTGLGTAASKAESMLNALPDGGAGICLWGVGDHGGGASAQDLDALAALQARAAAQGDNVKHSDPYEYFEGVDADKLPVWRDGINPWAVGCYTSQARLKGAFRALEDMYYSTEKAAMLALRRAGVPYPAEELKEAEKALLFATFHDYLPGSSVEPVEAMGLRQLGGANDKLTRVRARAFFALCSGEREAAPDEIPVLVFNPHPYPVEDVFECEFMLWDQGWGETVKYPRLFDESGTEIPCQPEKELSNIPIDWRKRIAFRASALPSGVTRFNCRFDDLKKLPIEQLPEENGELVFRGAGGRMRARISRRTGLLTSYEADGRELLSGGAFRLDVLRDNCDPWGMTVRSYRDVEGSFALIDDASMPEFCAVPEPVPAVRVIENGIVRTVVEAVLRYGRSRAYVRYTLNQLTPDIDISVRLELEELEKMVKLAIPCAGLNNVQGQTAYGRESLKMNGDETVSQRWKLMELEGERALLLCGRSTYGASVEGNEFKISLVRTPAYTGHPLGERRVLPADRYMPHMDLGTHLFEFRLTGGDRQYLSDRAERIAQTYCERPFCMSFFPSGEGTTPRPGLRVEGDDCVVLTAYKQSEYGAGEVLRLFNPTDEARTVRVVDGEGADAGAPVTLPPRAFETYLKTPAGLRPVPADEFEGERKVR